MGIRFRKSSSQHLSEAGSNAFDNTADDLTLSCWFKDVGSEGTYRYLWGFYADSNDMITIALSSSNVAIAATQFSGSWNAPSMGVYRLNAWNHAVFSIDSATSNKLASLNGNFSVNNTGTGTRLDNLANTSIGRLAGSTPVDYADSIIAECAAWNVILTRGEKLALSRGVPVTEIRPQNLIQYYPLRRNSTTVDSEVVSGGVTLTGTGGVDAPHPPSIKPRIFNMMPVAAAGGGSIPIFAHHYNHNIGVNA